MTRADAETAMAAKAAAALDKMDEAYACETDYDVLVDEVGGRIDLILDIFAQSNAAEAAANKAAGFYYDEAALAGVTLAGV